MAQLDLDLAILAEHGGSFDWLADEPDLCSLDDGEPVEALVQPSKLGGLRP